MGSCAQRGDPNSYRIVALSELRVIGTRQRKLDGRDKVMGRTTYVSDLRLPRMLVGKILRSPHAHARIVRVDAAAAEALPGVHAVVHAGNVTQRPFGYGLDNLPLPIVAAVAGAVLLGL